MRVGICTDSSSQLPADLAARLELEVVPMTIAVGDAEFLDGVDLGVDRFYEMTADRSLTCSASEPSPGQFVLAYDELAARGCTEILSVHASTDCANLRAACVAAREVAIPVRFVDCAVDGIGLGCCAITAAEAIAAGATPDEAVRAVHETARALTSTYIVDARPLLGATARCTTVRSRSSTGDREIGTASSLVDAVGLIADATAGAGRRLAVGIADRRLAPVRDALRAALDGRVGLGDVRLGPSAGTQVGPGTVICAAY